MIDKIEVRKMTNLRRNGDFSTISCFFASSFHFACLFAFTSFHFSTAFPHLVKKYAPNMHSHTSVSNTVKNLNNELGVLGNSIIMVMPTKS